MDRLDLEAKILERKDRIDRFIRRADRVVAPWLTKYLSTLMTLNQVNPITAEKGFGPPMSRRHLPTWTKIIEIFLHYYAFKMTLIICSTHDYNRVLFELSALNHTSASNYHTDADRQRIHNDYEIASRRLDWLGSPLRDAGFAFEINAIYEIAIFYLIYVGTRIIMKVLGRPFELSIMKFFMNEQKERANMRAEVIKQTDEFIASSRNHLMACRQGGERDQFNPFQMQDEKQIVELESVLGEIQLVGFRASDRLSGNNYRQRLMAHSIQMMRVSELLQGNRLLPFNRTDRWLSIMRLFVAFAHVQVQIFGAMVLVVTYFIYPFIICGAGFHLGKADILLMHEVLPYNVIGVQLLYFYAIMIVALAVDLSRYAHGILDKINELNHTINRMDWTLDNFGRLQLSATTDDHLCKAKLSMINHLDSSLLAILIHFKMFKSQMRYAQEFQRYGVTVVIIVMSGAPILGRFVAAHLDVESKSVCTTASITLLVICDFVIFPACYLQARCLSIYRRLNILLGELVYIEKLLEDEIVTDDNYIKRRKSSAQTTIRTTNSYDGTGRSTSGLRLSMGLLRRELRVPEALIEKFTTVSYFGAATYSNFLSVHFWVILLLISTWLKKIDTKATSLLGTFSLGL